MQHRTTFQFLVLLVVTHLGFAAEPQSKVLQQRYSGESVRRVEIELPPDTRLKIRTTSDAVISIEGNVNVRFDGSTSRSRRRAILDGIEVVGEMRGNRLQIFDGREGEAGTARARRLLTEFDITITLPEWTHVEVKQRNGRVDAKGAFGDVVIGMRAGEIDVAVPKKRVKELTAKTRIGEIKADFGRSTEQREGFLPGETRYENEAGQTIVRLKLTMGDISVALEE